MKPGDKKNVPRRSLGCLPGSGYLIRNIGEGKSVDFNEWVISRRRLVALIGASAGAAVLPRWAAGAEDIGDITPQPYFAAVNRALEVLQNLGAPVAEGDKPQLADLARQGDSAAIAAAEKILDRYTLARIVTNADGYAHTSAGGARRNLIEQGWSVFLVRVSNFLKNKDKLNATAGAWPMTSPSTGASRAGVPDTLNVAPYIAKNWLASQMYETAPFTPSLSGFDLEYRVVQLYSRDRGQHEAMFDFYTATDQYAAYFATGKKRGVKLDFTCVPTEDVRLSIADNDGRGCMASLTIKDKVDRVYPLQAMRLAPDMYFHPQIYRADGETVRLPDGEYTVESRRGPEYLVGQQAVTIGDGNRDIRVKLERWIDPAKWGWHSGDAHIHGGGCAHYERPTEGVSPETMIRHVRGEGLAIGEVLSWGPSWYYQKQFFTGRAESPQASLEHPELQAANNASLQPRPTPKDTESLLRYDVEVSGFPSSHCGHLILLRVKEQDYPGTKVIQDWPSWNLPVLRWGREQGAVIGYAHCGSGMEVDSKELPNYEIPPMDGIGTQEAIVDVTHGLTDFIAGCDTQPLAELNAWYHMLNCGYRLALIGETDYPCISGERPGMGRTYVQLSERPTDDAGYENWVHALKDGKLYCGDGRSHFLEFEVNRRRSGEADVTLKDAGKVSVEALVAARLEPELPIDAKAQGVGGMGGWHLENARIGTTRQVPVDLVVNGVAVEKTALLADGKPQKITFKTQIARSSWIAMRILPSSHTYPVFVEVDGKPIRASKRSAQWCRACVDKLWEVKSPFMRESERPAAAEAFNHARKTYEAIAEESEGA
jgi:hypothetical protein